MNEQSQQRGFGRVQSSSVLDRSFLSVQNALLHKLFRAWPALQPLLQTIRPHVHVEFLLVSLKSRRSVGSGENVAVNQFGAFGARVEALLEVIGCTLAL